MCYMCLKWPSGDDLTLVTEYLSELRRSQRRQQWEGWKACLAQIEEHYSLRNWILFGGLCVWKHDCVRMLSLPHQSPVWPRCKKQCTRFKCHTEKQATHRKLWFLVPVCCVFGLFARCACFCYNMVTVSNMLSMTSVFLSILILYT